MSEALRAAVEQVADWLAEQEAKYHDTMPDGGYSAGARDAYDLAESRLRDALRGST